MKNLIKKSALMFAAAVVANTYAGAQTKTSLSNDLDKTCKPCDDFYKYANGGWMTNNPIPGAYPAWGNFNILQDKNQNTLKTLLEEAAKTKAAPGSNEQKLSDFYFTAMDTIKIEKDGIAPLNAELKRIDDIKDLRGLLDVIVQHHKYQLTSLFAFYAYQDAK